MIKVILNSTQLSYAKLGERIRLRSISERQLRETID